MSARTRTVYEPKTPGGKGEEHEDFGMFSYDKGLKKIVLRQFHVEGLVNEYTMDGDLEFVSVRIENIPAGWRAKESFTGGFGG